MAFPPELPRLYNIALARHPARCPETLTVV
jgi:hypothetical protein